MSTGVYKNQTHLQCLEKVRKEIMDADPNITFVRFRLAGINGITGQAIEIGTKYKSKKQQKELVRQTLDMVTHDYCPFCGEKYK
jgi:hypothetical protein